MEDKQPVITIEDGQLRGTIKVDWLGGKYYSFQGIPYAKPPIGKLRFKAPQPIDAWKGIKDATKEGNDCYNRNLIKRSIAGSEDCLFLNVYTPQLEDNNCPPKPVMVWIHGGAFISGSGSTEMYGPDFLITENVVIVTVNYRIGLLGFASFAKPSIDIPGNAGLKDQVLALKWVQRNISRFGGNPKNVTIFGESAGGASVHFLMFSPSAKGLFHKAICQSGVSTTSWATGQLTAPLVAKVLELDDASEDKIVEILNTLPLEKILEIQEKFTEDKLLSKNRPVGPVVELYNEKSAFLSRTPNDILASGIYSHVPLMIGYTAREGSVYESMQKMMFGEIRWDANSMDVVPLHLGPAKNSDNLKLAVENIKQFYYGNKSASIKNIDEYYLLCSDTYFFLPINDVVRQQTRASLCPIYYYRMSIETQLNLIKKFYNLNSTGATHADDLGYLFKTDLTPEVKPNSQEDIGLRRFIKLWTTFAKYGNPNPVEEDNLINVTWPATENDKLHFLEIGENLSVGVNPESVRVRFWDEISDLYFSKSK